jgi:hypothetical protein
MAKAKVVFPFLINLRQWRVKHKSGNDAHVDEPKEDTYRSEI